MTEKDMDKLASKVADLVLNALIKKQKEWDEQFYNATEDLIKDANMTARMLSQEEILIEELNRLNKLLSHYEEEEAYEKAAIIQNKIQRIKKKIKKL
jgi:hypothetical protein|tara:strand:- start:226 stop:516 length:291 start_codon:yes stop_codon:yes gene_type:complete